MLCIRRTLAYGRLSGLISGLGAATADALYGTVAALGLTAISSLLVDHAMLLRLAGGLFLLVLGVNTLRARPAADAAAAPDAPGPIMAYLSTLVLTLTNPMTIFAFLGIFAGLGVSAAAGSDAVLMVAGVFIGSALWWLLLSAGVGLFRERFTPRWMRRVNILSGLIIVGFALLLLRDLLMGTA